jgi:hypothetical protein
MRPAYLTGMVLAPLFLADKELTHRIRIITFTVLTRFYFVREGCISRSR